MKSGSEMVKALQVCGKNILCSVNVDKTRGKKILKLYIGLSSCHLTRPGRPARQAGFIGACQLSPQKDNVGIQKFFFPLFWLSKLLKIYIMPAHFWVWIHDVKYIEKCRTLKLSSFLSWLYLNVLKANNCFWLLGYQILAFIFWQLYLVIII